tara:strand:- start:3840 stop:4616 length:777 start_codon:yes stop_codon:yes gene_type:complete
MAIAFVGDIHGQMNLQDYFDLENKISRLFEEPQDLDVDLAKLNEFSRELISTARENRYVVHSAYGKNPRVFVFGYYHVSGFPDQYTELARIFESHMRSPDILLLEGEDPCGVDYDDKGITNPLILKLKEVFKKRDIRTLFNDNTDLKNRAKLSTSVLEKFKNENPGYVNEPGFLELASEYVAAWRNRDNHFCENKLTGIVPFIDGTTKNYKPPSQDANFFQAFGAAHVYADIVGQCLRSNDVAHMMFVPKERFDAGNG